MWKRGTAGVSAVLLFTGAVTIANAAPRKPAPPPPAAEGTRVHALSRFSRTIPAFQADQGLRNVAMLGCRNGIASGQVVVSSNKAIGGLTVRCSALKTADGKGVIPAERVRIRYVRWEWVPGYRSMRGFDGLEESAPAEVAVRKEWNGAYQPVWLTVHVPADASAGAYTGAVTVELTGARPVTVPVNLTVADWTAPDPRTFVAFMDLIQSPDSVALQYNVPLWSEAHWRLVERSLVLLGEAGNRSLWVPLIARTHLGNEQSMVRWVRKDVARPPSAGAGDAKDAQPGAAGPRYGHDFTILDRYLDLGVKHMGRVPAVIFFTWEVFAGGGYFGKELRKSEKPVSVTTVDPDTGKVGLMEAPMFGTPESRPFWKPVFDAIRDRMAKRGMAGSMLTGASQDRRPYRYVLDDFKAFAPDFKWCSFSHGYVRNTFGPLETGYQANVWGTPRMPHPSEKRLYGWRQGPKAAGINGIFPRIGCSTTGGPLFSNSPLGQYRSMTETTICAGRSGVCRQGADFWYCQKDKRGRGRAILDRYPPAVWSNLGPRCASGNILAPGKDGPISSLRLEMIREGRQEVEARIAIEKALITPALRARLGEKTAVAYQRLLDDRTIALIAGTGKGGWPAYLAGADKRAADLYAAAGEVARKLANR